MTDIIFSIFGYVGTITDFFFGFLGPLLKPLDLEFITSIDDAFSLIVGTAYKFSFIVPWSTLFAIVFLEIVIHITIFVIHVTMWIAKLIAELIPL